MNTETTTWVSQLSRIGLGILAVLATFIILWLVLRYLVRRWQQRSETLRDRAGRTLQSFQRRLDDLEREADLYPSDIPAPYHEPVQALQVLLADGRRSHAELTKALDRITSEALQAPERPVAYVFFGLWQEPRFRFRRMTALKQLRDRVRASVAASQPADRLLKDLRAKPLQTARRAQRLDRMLREADETLDRLTGAGLHGETKETWASTIADALAQLEALPTYFIEGSDSQIIRRATDREVTQAWEALAQIEAQAGDAGPRMQRWSGLHAEFGKALDAAHQAVTQTTETLDRTHPAIDVRAWKEEWTDVRTEIQELTTTYETPTVEDLERIDRVESIIERGLDLCSRLASLERDRLVLTRAVPRYHEQLRDATMQLRQLAGAARYPLSRQPLQDELDTLAGQASAIGKTDQVRVPDQLERETEAAQRLLQASQAFLEKITAIRESRAAIISLVKSLDEELEPDFARWAEDLQARTSRHAPEDWSPDLRVHQIVTDARAIEARRDRWVPSAPGTPVPTDDLARRADEIRRLIEGGLRIQRRLDRITDRLQAIDAMDRRSREALDTAYQALDRLALRAADVVPPLDEEQRAIRAAMMDLLEQGYKLDMVFDPPTQGKAEDRTNDVQSWLGDCQATLETWLQAINRELAAVHQALASELQSLNALAPLSLEPAVQETRARLDAQATFEALPRSAHAGSRAPHLVTLGETLGDRLRTRTRLYQTTAFLQSDVIEALTPPRDAWTKARREAEQQLRHLLDIEEKAQITWLPLSCDAEAVKAQMTTAHEAETYLKHHGDTVPQVIARLREATNSYAKAIAMAGARAQRHKAVRAHIERRIKDIERWEGNLARYRQAHDEDADTVAAVRARIEEIDAAMRRLRTPYQKEGRLLSPEEAKRSIEDLWEQAHRDLPLGAGDDVIPVRHVERGW